MSNVWRMRPPPASSETAASVLNSTVTLAGAVISICTGACSTPLAAPGQHRITGSNRAHSQHVLGLFRNTRCGVSADSLRAARHLPRFQCSLHNTATPARASPLHCSRACGVTPAHGGQRHGYARRATPLWHGSARVRGYAQLRTAEPGAGVQGRRTLRAGSSRQGSALRALNASNCVTARTRSTPPPSV